VGASSRAGLATLSPPNPSPVRPLQQYEETTAVKPSEMEFLTMTPRWALSPLDWHAHAIDPYTDHPLGLSVARCGPQLLGGTDLHDDSPIQRCPTYARWSPTKEAGSGQ